MQIFFLLYFNQLLRFVVKKVVVIRKVKMYNE